MSDETCSRTGCGKKLRSDNTKGVCGSNCLSPEAPAFQRAAGVGAAVGGGSPATPRKSASDTLKRFRIVANALGKDPDAILEEAAQEWLSALEKAVS